MIDEDSLANIYFIVRSMPYWLGYCIDAGYSKEEIEFLENLDIELMDYHPEQDCLKWELEINKKGGEDVVSAETEQDQIAIITKRIEDLYLDLSRLISGSSSYANVIIQRKKLREEEKSRNYLRAKIIQRENPNKDDLQDWEIERARLRPLKDIIEADLKHDRMPCPFHKGDGLNFSVKGNFGYCFVCNEWCDALKWLMKIQGMNFKDAVRRLCR